MVKNSTEKQLSNSVKQLNNSTEQVNKKGDKRGMHPKSRKNLLSSLRGCGLPRRVSRRVRAARSLSPTGEPE